MPAPTVRESATNHRALATIPGHNPLWSAHVEDFASERVGAWSDHVHLWRASRDREVVFLNGALGRSDRYRDLLFAIVLKAGARLTGRPRPRVVVHDATWEPGSRALTAALPWLAPVLPTVARAAIRLVDGPHVHYVVLSSDETRTFPRLWGVDPERVGFQPFPHTLEDTAGLDIHDGGYLWAGGNSLRDYDLLERALRGPEGVGLGFDTRVHARWSPSDPASRIEAGPTPHEEFVRSLAGARAAVVPLRATVRSAGQQTYLNAMVLGKPVVVTAAPGVLDYIRPGVTGVVVEPRVEALRAALADVMDPANAARYARMGQAAREDVLTRFTDATYRAGLLRHAGLIA